ncbi:MAG: hypothetical protein JNM70_01965 [Anaerolineae bacterium]|nr:hypothetical protein [Anaerolineae bacterium]
MRLRLLSIWPALSALLCLLLLAGCQGSVQDFSPTPPVATQPAENAEREVYAQVEGVRLSLSIPSGWEAQRTPTGILIAEHFPLMQDNQYPGNLQLHIFVQRVEELGLPIPPTATNLAWTVLQEVVTRPAYIGEATATAPREFEWSGHAAAYYLLNNGDSTVSLVMALAIQQNNQLVALNFSTTLERSQLLRPMLPDLLDTLTINDAMMDPSALDALPDPLIFPEYGGSRRS